MMAVLGRLEEKIVTSDCGLQQIIVAALVDKRVLTTLVENPLALADRFALTLPERRFIVQARPQSLEHFAALVDQDTVGLRLRTRVEPVRLAG
jgi:hypothetical protein